LARTVTTLYGIPNCDTVKRARAWLDAKDVVYRFHDFKRHGLDAELAARFLAALGPEVLINRNGTTWRKLDDAARAGAGTREGALAMMLAQPSVIKRPLLDIDGSFHVGFADAAYRRLFA
jgi:Spx/MgsR family transcriptional regulator